MVIIRLRSALICSSILSISMKIWCILAKLETVFASYIYCIYHGVYFQGDTFFGKPISAQTYVYFHKNQYIHWLYRNCSLNHNFGIHLVIYCL